MKTDSPACNCFTSLSLSLFPSLSLLPQTWLPCCLPNRLGPPEAGHSWSLLWTILGLTDLVDEGSEPVVKTLDLLLLLMLHTLRVGVNLQVEGREETLVD